MTSQRFEHRHICTSHETLTEELRKWSTNGWELMAAIREPGIDVYRGVCYTLFWKRPADNGGVVGVARMADRPDGRAEIVR